MLQLGAPRSVQRGFRDQQMRARPEIARHLHRKDAARRDFFHQGRKQAGMVGQPVQRRIGVDQVKLMCRPP